VVVGIHCETPSRDLVRLNIICYGGVDFICKPGAGCIWPVLDRLRSCPFRSGRVCDTRACTYISKLSDWLETAYSSFQNPQRPQHLASMSRAPWLALIQHMKIWFEGKFQVEVDNKAEILGSDEYIAIVAPTCSSSLFFRGIKQPVISTPASFSSHELFLASTAGKGVRPLLGARVKSSSAALN
jgi:hypothetical protein